MASTLKTPGVYIEERNAFPNSVVAADTAVPVFIGYTGKAQYKGKDLLRKATRISSLAEYIEVFGGPLRAVYTLEPAAAEGSETIRMGDRLYTLKRTGKSAAYFYDSIRLFYANGGGSCYILPIGTYGENPGGFEVRPEDYLGGNGKPNVFDLLQDEPAPTLVVLPDANALGAAAYPVYQHALLHCLQVQSRFLIVDVPLQEAAGTEAITDFRQGIGMNGLGYGAAYHPWLRTTIVSASEIGHRNLDAADLERLLPEPAAGEVIRRFRAIPQDAVTDGDRAQYERSLQEASPAYCAILDAIRRRANLLPPSGAMAGIYTMVDLNRGVWKAPANVSLNAVLEPVLKLTDRQQEGLNVDASGKSINVIRSFAGAGTLVWGARTLDGNSQDWRYVNVRRTILMIEQSVKMAVRAYVFEPNDSGTWNAVRSMIGNFFYTLWKQGALAGSSPSDAYDVQIGLGSTMTAADILDGLLCVSIRVAVVRPAEFIEITFSQQQQRS